MQGKQRERKELTEDSEGDDILSETNSFRGGVKFRGDFSHFDPEHFEEGGERPILTRRRKRRDKRQHFNVNKEVCGGIGLEVTAVILTR